MAAVSLVPRPPYSSTPGLLSSRTRRAVFPWEHAAVRLLVPDHGSEGGPEEEEDLRDTLQHTHTRRRLRGTSQPMERNRANPRRSSNPSKRNYSGE
jgi:hypothetical protein